MKGFEFFDEELFNVDVPDPENISKECYIITIKNNSEGKLKNVEVGNAYENLQRERLGIPLELIFSCEKVVDDNNKTEITYEEFLKLTQHQPFKVGRTYRQYPMGDQCLTDAFIYSEGKNSNWTYTLDPYRQQTNIQIYMRSYLFDKETKIILSELYPKSYCKIYLYLHKPIKRGKS